MRRVLLITTLLAALAVPAFAQRTVGPTDRLLNTANACHVIPLRDMGTAAVQVTGIASATVTWTVAAGTGTYVAIDAFAPDTPGTAANSTTGNGVWTMPVAGLSSLRACIGASGSATVTLSAVGTGGGGGGGSATASLTLQEADDASIAGAQTADVAISLGMAFDTTVWRRVTFGTAGTASAQVWTVQGIASMTPLSSNLFVAGTAAGQTNPAPVRLSDGTNYLTPSTDITFGTTTYTETTSTGPLVGGVRNDTLDSLANTANEAAPFAFTAQGGLWIAPSATTNGGATPVRYISAGATEDEHAVCTAACHLYAIVVTNTNAAARYLKCENDTAAGTAPGTDTPEFAIALQATGGATVSIEVGLSFTTALTCWLVTGAADSDVAEVAANEIMVNYAIKQ